MTTVMTVRPLRAGGWKVSAQRTGRPWWVGRRTFTAGQVVLAAGAHGTRRLLADMRDRGVLNHLSARLGEPTPTGGDRDGWGTHAGHAGPDGREMSAGHTALRHLVATVRSRTGAGTIGLPGTDRELGGCCIGGNPRDGVIDAYHRVFGYPSLSVVGAAAVTADPGVNPALTVCAQAERAAAFWPNVDEPDPRPGQGGVYRRIDAVRPEYPLDAAAVVQGKSDGAPGTQPVQPRDTPAPRPHSGVQTDESGRHWQGDEPERRGHSDEPGRTRQDDEQNAGGQDPSNS
ncbi:GMC oxidoreductase [Nocardia sp. NPDC055321]